MSSEYYKWYGLVYKQVRLVAHEKDDESSYVRAVKPSFKTNNMTVYDSNCEGLYKYYLKLGVLVQLHHTTDVFENVHQLGHYLTTYHLEGYVQTREVQYLDNENGYFYTSLAFISSIIPRSHVAKPEIINCMRIYSSKVPNRKYTDRTSTRYDHSGYKDMVWRDGYGLGFEQLTVSECEKELKLINNEVNKKHFTSYVGIYVPKNTTLLMIDTIVTLSERGAKHERTVFQEGSFIILENIELRFNDFHYTTQPNEWNLMNVFNFDELKVREGQRLKGNKRLNPIYILRPDLTIAEDYHYKDKQPFLTVWGLVITHHVENTKKIAILQIPPTTQIERVYEWGEGVRIVSQKMMSKPWDKYVLIRATETENQDFKCNEFSGPYPGYDANDLLDNQWPLPSDSDVTLQTQTI